MSYLMRLGISVTPVSGITATPASAGLSRSTLERGGKADIAEGPSRARSRPSAGVKDGTISLGRNIGLLDRQADDVAARSAARTRDQAGADQVPPPQQGHLALPRRPLGRGGGPRSGRGPVGAATARYAARAHAVELSIYPVWPTRRDRAGYRRGEGFGYSISQRASDPS